MKLLPDTYKRLFALSGLAAFLWLVLGVQLYTNPGFNLAAAITALDTSSAVNTTATVTASPVPYDVFPRPTGLWIAPTVYNGTLYGPSSPNAVWHLAQWNNPGGNVPAFKNNIATSPTLGVEILSPGSYSIRQTTPGLTCNLAGDAGEYDAFLQPISGPYAAFPQATSTKPFLSTITSLNENVTVKPVSFSYLDFGCPVTQYNNLLALQLINGTSHQVFYYQLILSTQRNGQTLTHQQPYWWWPGTPGNGLTRFGLDDRIDSTFGKPTATVGVATTYSLDVYPRLKEIITSGSYGMDTDLSHWRINNLYIGSGAWGHITATTEWSNYSLTATPVQPAVSIKTSSETVSYNGNVNLSWSSSNTSSCTVTGPNSTGTFTSKLTSGSSVVPIHSAVGTTLTYTIRCIGASGGDASTATAKVVVSSVGAPVDLTRPLVVLTSPTSSPISGRVIIAASSTDAGGISHLRFQVDGISVGPLDVTPPYQMNWDSTTVPDGAHTFTATAWDTSGNARITGPRVVRVLNTATSTAALRVLPTCKLTASSTAVANTAFPISWTVNNTAQTAVLKLGNETVQGSLTLPAGTTTVTAPSTPGPYTYVMVLTGANGLVGACGRDIYVSPALVQTTKALPVPTVSPAPGTYQNSVTVTVQAQAGATIHYSLDTTVPTCSTGRTYTGPIVLNTTTTIKALACPGLQAGTGGLLQRISGFFQSLVAAVVVAVTGATTYTPSSVGTFTYTVVQQPATNAYTPRGYTGLANQASQSCEIGGWTCDLDNLSQNLNVEFYEGSTKLGSMQTNFERAPLADLAAACGASQKSDGTFTGGYTPAKGFRAVLTLPKGTHWIDAYALDIDSTGKPTGTKTLLQRSASYTSPVVCDPSIMTGNTLTNTTQVK
jgi:hypothetical protein